ADGKVYLFDADGAARGEVETGPAPVIALTISGDGRLVAAAGIRGSVAIIERASRTLARTLAGPGLPVRSLAFFPDNHTLLRAGPAGPPPGGGGAGLPRGASGWARRRPVRGRPRPPPLPAPPAPPCSAPASPATPCTPTKATGPARACTTSSAGASPACPATI